MGLLDKIKNLFTDEEEILEEEEIEVEEETKKKVREKEKVRENIRKEEKVKPKEEVEIESHPLPTFMREKIEKEERVINIEKEEKQEEDNKFKFPFVFDEADFEPEKRYNEPVVQKVKKEEKKSSNLYNHTKNSKQKETKKFKPTPIISPVYGILDKNYKKEEVKSKPEGTYKITRASKKVDFETVRMKAFGSLSDEINNNLVNEEDNVEVIDSNNLLYEITNDKDTTIANAEENYYDFGVSYEVPKSIDLTPTTTTNTNTNDNYNDNNNDDNDIKIINHNEEEAKAEKIEVKEEPIEKLSSTVVEDASRESDLELTEDLFSLIDAMYDERNDK